MKENRLEWLDSDWAEYLHCPVTEIPRIRNLMQYNFVLTIKKDKKTGKYYFALSRRNYTPAGFKRLHDLKTPVTYFDTKHEAIEDANKYMSEQLFPAVGAKLYKIPQRAIQMVLIREK